MKRSPTLPTLAALALISAFAAGCASSSMKQVAVDADRDTRMELTGAWEGVLEGTTSADQGRIQFQLETGRHTALAAVRLYDEDEGVRVVPLETVKVDGKVFTGKTAPFRSRSCDCLVRTEFRGLVKGDVIDGTYTSVAEGAAPELERTGSWAIYREGSR